MKPKTPEQAFADYERKQEALKRAAKRAASGQLEPQRFDGAGERRYQRELEARGQMRLFGGDA